MMSDLYRTRLAGLVKTGKLPQAVVDEAARRVLRVKFALGLFDHPYADETQARLRRHAGKARARPQARRRSRSCCSRMARAPSPMREEVLPMAKNTPTIALIGPLADSAIDMLGSWTGRGRSEGRRNTAHRVAGALRPAKTKLLYAKGTEILTDSDAGFDEAIAAAKKGDVVIMALGESAPRDDRRVVLGHAARSARATRSGCWRRSRKLGKPTVFVLFDGRPLAIKWAANNVPAIWRRGIPGIEAGPAVADILFGDTNPSGKLTATFPRAVGQEPLFYNQLPTGRPAEDIDLTHPPTGEDKYFSRYIDETNAPLFPFGYGLSYTTFAYSQVELSQAQHFIRRR